jgi:hypothetical protein
MKLSNSKQDERNRYDETRIENVPGKLLLKLAAVRLLFTIEGESK